jgi:sugar O-acyltransferase (sialic acid O-acetyltransferase NeuD family)
VSNDQPARWLIFACRSSYAPEVAEIIWRRGDEIEALVDNLDESSSAPLPRLPGIPIMRPDDLNGEQRALPLAIPLITPGHRHAVVEQVRALGVTNTPALIDPVSVVARTAEIGEATVINTSVTIGANTTLGFGVHVNRSASLGHDDVIDDFATIGPCVALAGGVHIGRGAFLGVGAICAPEVRIGENAVVGAGAVVVKDVEPGAVVVGNPARVIRVSETGYGGVAVPC